MSSSKSSLPVCSFSLSELELLLLKYQQISIAIRDHLKVTQVNSKQCQKLLKAALRGALNCKSTVNNHISSHQKNEEDDEEIEDLVESLDIITQQFRKFGDIKFKFSESTGIKQRDDLVNTDLANIWTRHCISCRDSKPSKPTRRFIDIAYPQSHYSEAPLMTTEISHWKAPRGHTSYSWLTSDTYSTCTTCWGQLLGIVAHVRGLEISESFRELLLNSQVIQVKK